MSKLAKLAITLALAGCASAREGGQGLKLDATTVQTVQDQGGWTAEFQFAPPDAATPLSKTLSKPSAAVPPLPFDFDFDHGALLNARYTGQLPKTTTTTGSAKVDEDSWFKRTFHLGFGFWTKVLIAAGAAIALLLAWRFRSGLLGGVLKLIRGG